MPDELEAVLRLVAEGRLTPDEAAPIIEALTRVSARDAEADRDAEGEWGFDERITRRLDDRLARAGRRIARAQARVEAARDRIGAIADGPRHLRIRITERGRQTVNLRIPIGFVDTALRFVPGLGGDQADRIRETVRAGIVGPIIDVEDADGQGGVLISVE